MTPLNVLHDILSMLWKDFVQQIRQLLLGQRPSLLPLVRALDDKGHVRCTQLQPVWKLLRRIQNTEIQLNGTAGIAKLCQLSVQIIDALRDVDVR